VNRALGAANLSVERPGALAALFYAGFASAGLLLFKPLIVGALIDDYQFSARQAGLIAGAEMLGIGTAALLLVTIARGRSRRLIITCGTVLGMIGCFAPLGWHSFEALVGLRLLAGLGSGLIASTVLASLGTTRNPDRTFGLYFMFNYAVAAMLFPLMPHVLERYGASGGYVVLGLILGAVLLVCMRIPARLPCSTVAAGTAALPFPLRAATLSLGVSLAYWIGNGAVWAFIERLGHRASVAGPLVATILAAGQFASIGGALAASLCHTRLGRSVPILVTICLSVASLVLIGSASQAVMFASGALLFCFAWSSFLAYLGGVMASQDAAGRIVALSVSSQTLGMAAGPAIGGALADASGYGAVVLLGIACHIGALILLLPLVRARSAGASARLLTSRCF
jgi:predicted MFS family arabinose efflux permease